jgi:glycosyltransferase involved in cell wall biosynthesis
LPIHYSITFVIPVFNEAKYLLRMLESIDRQVLKKNKIEVLLIDGKSSDDSLKIISDFIKKSLNRGIDYKIIENKDRKTPYAFNLGIRHSKSEIVGFGGAHSIYPPDFFSNVISLMANLKIDVVGGGLKKYIPDKNGILNRATSAFYVSPIGGGVASYHRKKEKGFVDTVFGGFYRKEIFDVIGIFNTKLFRGQDYELNLRLRQAGYKIYYDPLLNSDYIIKSSLKSFLSRAFLTGRFLPDLWKIDMKNLKVRHIVPFCFLIYISFILFLAMKGSLSYFFSIPMILYVLLIICSSLWLFFFKKYGLSSFITPFVFFLYHLFYGFGTLIGSIKVFSPFLNKN